MNYSLVHNFKNGEVYKNISPTIYLEGSYELALVSLKLKSTTPVSPSELQNQNLLVLCNVVKNSYFDGKSEQVLYTMEWNQSETIEKPVNLIYIPIFEEVISSLTLSIVDSVSKTKLMDITGRVWLHLRPSACYRRVLLNSRL